MRYYPVEFTAAMLNSVMGINEKVAYYIRFAESSGIKVLPPDINKSYSKFTVSGNTIRFGLAAVKNVGENVVESIVKCRNEKGLFKDLPDFCNKVDTTTINKRAVESLIKVGAFDEFGVFRSRLLAVYEKLLDSATNQKKKNIEGQMSLFGADFGGIVEEPRIQYPNIKEFNKRNILSIEKEMTGLYLSGHPLDDYKKSLKIQTNIDIEKILQTSEMMDETEESALITDDNTISDGQRVIIGGIISAVNRKVTRSNDIMAFMTVEDLTASMEVIVFPKTLKKVNSMVNEDELVVVKGRVSIREDEEPKILCEDILPLEKIDSSKVFLRVESAEKLKEAIPALKVLLMPYRGSSPLYVYAEKEKQKFRMGKEMWLDIESDGIDMLKERFGENNVKVVD